MTTSYAVTDSTGTQTFTTLTDVVDYVRSHAGATVQAVVTVDAPCTLHPAFEASNCPTCGTARI